MISRETAYVAPVSYTHLDVYKRQVYGITKDIYNKSAYLKMRK